MNIKYFTKLVLLAFILLFINACTTFKIVDLKQEDLNSYNNAFSTNAVAGVKTIRVIASEYGDAKQWEQGLADVLRDEGVFKSVSHPYIDQDTVDVLISGEVGGAFRHEGGAANFFTWWPGPFVLAHNWRGTHYIFDAYADIKTIDALTGELLGEYHAESSFELIHKSNNPGPIFGAATVIPGIVKGGMSVSPRAKYRKQMYEVAYPNLWKKIAHKINDDLSKKLAQKVASLKDRCQQYLDQDPKIGMLWTEFTSCQTRNYILLGQEPMGTDVVSVYLRNDRYFRVHVSHEGRIIRWFVQKKQRK